MGKKLDLARNKFGKLTVIELYEMKNGRSYWKCKCDCGNIGIVLGSSLTTKHTMSCVACGHKRTNISNTKHGMTSSPEYQSWHGMLQRCENSNAKFYKYYGGRGILVCNEWHDFKNFYNDMGKRPTGTTLDRKNSNGNYDKENCKWATKEEQSNNRSSNHLITFNGKTKTIMQWANETNLAFETLRERLFKYNWPIEKALTTKVREHKHYGH